MESIVQYINSEKFINFTCDKGSPFSKSRFTIKYNIIINEEEYKDLLNIMFTQIRFERKEAFIFYIEGCTYIIIDLKKDPCIRALTTSFVWKDENIPELKYTKYNSVWVTLRDQIIKANIKPLSFTNNSQLVLYNTPSNEVKPKSQLDNVIDMMKKEIVEKYSDNASLDQIEDYLYDVLERRIARQCRGDKSYTDILELAYADKRSINNKEYELQNTILNLVKQSNMQITNLNINIGNNNHIGDNTHNINQLSDGSNCVRCIAKDRVVQTMAEEEEENMRQNAEYLSDDKLYRFAMKRKNDPILDPKNNPRVNSNYREAISTSNFLPTLRRYFDRGDLDSNLVQNDLKTYSGMISEKHFNQALKEYRIEQGKFVRQYHTNNLTQDSFDKICDLEIWFLGIIKYCKDNDWTVSYSIIFNYYHSMYSHPLLQPYFKMIKLARPLLPILKDQIRREGFDNTFFQYTR